MKYLPTRNTFVILIFGGGMLLFILLAIFPNYISYNNIVHEIDALEGKIEEQKILSPIFEDLSRKAQFQKPGSLPFPKPENLPREDTETVSRVIRELAEGYDFTLRDIDTDIESLMTGSGLLKMSVKLTGNFQNLRNLLLDLGGLAYLEHIELIQINSARKKTSINLTIWMSQEPY